MTNYHRLQNLIIEAVSLCFNHFIFSMRTQGVPVVLRYVKTEDHIVRQTNQARNWLKLLLIAVLSPTYMTACQSVETTRDRTVGQTEPSQANPKTTPTAGQAQPSQPNSTPTTGWAVFGPDGKPIPSATLKAQDGAVVLNYQRDDQARLAHYQAPIAGFKTFTLRVKSAQALPLAIWLQDADNAQFMATREVPAQVWQSIELNPNDFKLAKESPVKKPNLDPSRATKGYLLFDIGAYSGKKGNNELQVVFDNVKKGS
jgi:hypothetical protein